MERVGASVASFVARGVRFETHQGVTSVYGPTDDAGLLDELRAAVRARMPGYGVRIQVGRGSRRGRSEGCQFCGDPMVPGRSGDCALCRIAGFKKREEPER